MTFRPGDPKPAGSGRAPGTPNRITRMIKESLEAVLTEPESGKRLRALRDAKEPADRATSWRLASRLVPTEVATRAECARDMIYRIETRKQQDSPVAEHPAVTEVAENQWL